MCGIKIGTFVDKTIFRIYNIHKKHTLFQEIKIISFLCIQIKDSFIKHLVLQYT